MKYRKGCIQPFRVGDVKMLSVVYVCVFIARHLLCSGSCDACKACLIPEALSPADAYIRFKECSSTVHSLTYPTEKLVEVGEVEVVGTAVTILEGMISDT
jgi:hypothetical protein